MREIYRVIVLYKVSLITPIEFLMYNYNSGVNYLDYRRDIYFERPTLVVGKGSSQTRSLFEEYHE